MPIQDAEWQLCENGNEECLLLLLSLLLLLCSLVLNSDMSLPAKNRVQKTYTRSFSSSLSDEMANLLNETIRYNELFYVL